jgi:hypothetical protein
MTRYKVQKLWVLQKWFIFYEFLLSGRVHMVKYVFWRIIFAQTSKNSLRNINNFPKTTGNKAQAIKLMMPALNITIGYVRLTKIFHNITISLCFKSVTSPVTSKLHENMCYLKNGNIPAGFFYEISYLRW